MIQGMTNAVLASHLTPPSAHGLLSENIGDDNDLKAPKKRAETWVQEEIKALIAFRREVDSLFNTTKSNKHLWEMISAKMKDRGFERSPTMCIDKWRNLLKEYKKAKHHDKGAASKMSWYRELEELLGDRARLTPYRSPAKLDLSPKVIGRSQSSLERRFEQDGNPTPLQSSDAAVGSGLSPWNWRDSFSSGGNRPALPGGKIIIVRYENVTRRIGIDGSYEAIKDAIRAAFGLRTRRAFWLEDEDGVIWSIDRDMPAGIYILNVDKGVTIKICIYDGSDHITGATEERTFYLDDEFRDFLARRGWSALREVGGGFQDVECIAELTEMSVYQRAGLLDS